MPTSRVQLSAPFVLAGLALATVLGASACSGSSGQADAAPAVAAAAAAAANTEDPSTITAVGSGRATGTPDLLTAQLGIHTEGATAAGTLNENNLRTVALMDTLKQQGVDAKDIQTRYVNVGPKYDLAGHVTGYETDDTFTVKLRNLDTAGATLDALANVAGDYIRVQGVSYSLDDDSALKDDARADAVAKAKAQAAQMAQAAGVKLGALKTIAEVQPDTSSPYDFALASGRAADQASVPVPLAAGSLDVSVQVSLVYEIAS
jgi:uncharacterized protein YggE